MVPPPANPYLLKQRRQALNLTQVQVAKAIGVSQPTYQNYESGYTPVPEAKAKRLMTVLKLSREEMLGKPRPVAKPSESSELEETVYWGEVTAHFAKGKPLVLPILYGTYKDVFRQLQSNESRFVFVDVPLLNRLVAIRKAAITDIYLSDDGSSSFGPEQDTYDITPFFRQDVEDFWPIAEELLSEGDREELNDQYGESAVTMVARAIGIDLPRDIDRLIEQGHVKSADRELVLKEAAETRDNAERLSLAIDWQLSNGTARSTRFDFDADFLRYWWMVDQTDPESQGQMIIVDIEDAQTAFIQPDSLDYFAIPVQRFKRAADEQTDELDLDEDDPAPAKKPASRKPSKKS